MKNEDLNLEDYSNMENEEGDDTEQEAIELLKSQHEQIQKLKYQNENKSKMIKMMKNQIVTLSDKLKYFESNFKDCENIKTQFEVLIQEKEHLRSQLYEKEQLTSELQNEFNEITSKFQILNDKLSSQEDSSSKVAQLVELVRQYSKELTEATQKNKMYEKEVNKLNNELSCIMKKDQKIEIEKRNIEKEIKEDIEITNKDLNLFCQWIDNYLGVYFDHNIEIPDAPMFYNKKINFEILREKILFSRKKIYQQQSTYEISIQKLHNEQIDLLSKIEKLNKNIQFLNNEKLQLQEEISRLNSNQEEINNKMNKAQIDICNKAQTFIAFLSKLNKKMIKLNPTNSKFVHINEDINNLDTQNIFENNFLNLLDYVIDLEAKNENLNENAKNSITKSELETVKGFYQSRIDSLENEQKTNFDIIQLLKDDKSKLINQLRETENQKNKILQDNLILIKQNQSCL